MEPFRRCEKISGKFSALYIYKLPWTLYEIEINKNIYIID